MTPPDDEELIVFGLTWAARRYMRHMDKGGYERLVQRYGEPDHPMIRYARGFVYSDLEAMAASAPDAVAELRRQGDDYVADLVEVAALALTLLLTGRLEELDTLVAALAERYRAQGPPTCLSWALTMLGLSATLQGRHDQAWQLLDESANVAVPARTHTLKNPLEARAALRRGNRSRAVRSLRSYIDELLDHDNMYLARLACVEFANMMAELDNLPDAARMLGHLETSGVLDDALAYRGLADTAKRVAAHDLEPQPSGELNDRQALAYMRDVLDRLAAEI